MYALPSSVPQLTLSVLSHKCLLIDMMSRRQYIHTTRLLRPPSLICVCLCVLLSLLPRSSNSTAMECACAASFSNRAQVATTWERRWNWIHWGTATPYAYVSRWVGQHTQHMVRSPLHLRGSYFTSGSHGNDVYHMTNGAFPLHQSTALKWQTASWIPSSSSTMISLLSK